MKKKFLWLLLSFLLVAALVLASCAKEEVVTPGEQEEEEVVAPGEEEEVEVVVPEAGAPQYGGTFSLFTEWGAIEPVGFDPFTTTSTSTTTIWVNPFLEWLVKGDIEKYGPRGTNEFGFQLMEYVPEQYLTGQLAESWEITGEPLSMIFYLRHGVMWTGNAHIGMEPREFIADDVVFCLNRIRGRPGYESNFTFIKSVTATDRYTVVVELNNYNANWNWLIGGGFIYGAIYPREVVEAGSADWRNWCGTGPFILTEYVEGSYLAYERNPNYWGKTTISGKEYQTPFIDKVIYPIIPDESTQIAALRTAKIDDWPRVPMVYADSLAKTCPETIQSKWLSGRVVMWRINSLPGSKFSDLKIRRALMIGTDLKAVRNAVYVEGDVHSFPIGRGSPEYTPFEELPASTRELFTYDPVKAKQMLADAGFPNGFECSVVITAKTEWLDIASMVASMWGKIGVKLDIRVMEQAAYVTAWRARSYDLIVGGYTVVAPFTILNTGLSPKYYGSASLDDPYFDEKYWEAIAIMDPAERTAKTKELALYYLDNIMSICFANSYNLSAYWPWVKNYYGELEAGYYDMMPMISRMWIDQDLKAEMGH